MEKLPILKQQISDHPQFPNVERFVVIRNYGFETDYEQMKFDAHIEYRDKETHDLLDSFKEEILDWVINNSTQTTVRNNDGTPKDNPAFNPDIPESEPFMKLPSYRYFYLVVTNEDPKTSVPLVPLLRAHITLNDTEIKFFDKCRLGTRN